MDVNKKIEELKLVPVVVLQDAKDAVPLAKALIAGGLPVAEVTFRTAAAADSIKAISEACPEMLVGAGTVTNLEQAKKAKEAGAKFIVTPGFSKTVTEFAVENNIPVFPGVCTPTEIMMVMEYNLPVVKFFPAEAAGGLNMIKSMAAPYTKMKFMPTGGINAKNLTSYLDFKKIIACGGSWMVNKDMIAAKEMAAMKEGAYIINTARGGIVNEHDLYEAVKSGHIAGAALDVSEQEPMAEDNPLRTLENVIITPHIGMYSKEAIGAVSLLLLVRFKVSIPKVICLSGALGILLFGVLGLS